MEAYFCAADCQTCSYEPSEKAICLQARIMSELGIPGEDWVDRHSANFRSLWDAGITGHEELSEAIRDSHAKVFRIVPIAA